MKKQTHIFLITIMAISFLGHLLIYSRLPQTVPIHWGASGRVDGYGPKYMDLILAASPVLMYVLMRVLPNIDPKTASYQKHEKAYEIFIAALTFFMIGMSWTVPLTVFGIQMNMSTITMIAVGVLFLLMGNFMPQIRPNYTFGIKTPWTLENEWVWKKTHQAGGILFCLLGVLMIAAAFLGVLMVPSIILIIAATGWLYYYSWRLYQKVKEEE